MHSHGLVGTFVQLVPGFLIRSFSLLGFFHLLDSSSPVRVSWTPRATFFILSFRDWVEAVEDLIELLICP